MACVEKPTETYDRALSFCLQFGVGERLVERDGGGCTFRWTSGIHTGFCQQDLEDKYDSIQWYARFGRFTFWQYDLFYFLLPGSVFLECFFFSSHENLTIANWYDFWHVFTFTSNPMSRSAVSWGMVPGYIFGSQYDASVTNEAAVLVWQKKTNQRPKDVLFKPTSLTYATEN